MRTRVGEDALADIVARMPVSFLTLDRDWRLTFVNETVVEALGEPGEALLGRTLWETFPLLQETSAGAELRKAMAEHVASAFEATSLARDGWSEVHAFPTGTGLSLLFTDITARKRAEREALEVFVTTSLLLESAEALAAHSDIDEILPVFADTLLQAVPHERIAIALYDDRRADMTILYSAGEGAYPKGTAFPLAAVSGPARRAIEEQRPTIVDYDRLADQEAGAARKTGGRLSLVVPLVLAGRLVGMITLDSPNERIDVSPRAVRVVEGISAQAAAVIESARLLAAQVRRSELAEMLDDVNRVIHSSLEAGDTIQKALELAGRNLGADAGSIFLDEGGESAARFQYGFPEGFLGTRYGGELFPFSEMLEETRDPVAIGEERMGELMHAGIAQQFGVRSLLAVPLQGRGRLIGGIGLVFREPHDFAPDELDFARKFGASVSLALENARLFEAEHAIAETLQTALLVLPDEIEGITFAHAYHSATEAARVGGDFYDLFELEHGLLGVTVGDMSGHGVDAAVLTSLVKNTIRVQATEQDKTPAEVVAGANSVLFRSSPVGVFATIFFGVLDRRDGRLVYCNAGHTTGACLCTVRGVTWLEANSPLVGAFGDAAFRDSAETLDVGGLLFLYTDGLTEARRDGELFGEERLFDILAGQETSPHPEGVAARVLDAVLSFSRGRLSDDLAILALRRESAAAALGPSATG